MATPQYNNRYKFWTKNKTLLLNLKNGRYSSYARFEFDYFKDDSNFTVFYNLIRDKFGFPDDKETAAKMFACDLQWAKDKGYCGTIQTTPPNQAGGTQTPPSPPSQDQGGSSSSGSGSFGRDVSFTADDVANGKNIGYGMRGDIVGKIQERLIKHGFTNISKDGKVDKLYGSRTRNSVKEFQKTHKDKDGVQLKDDGVVGPKTWWALLREPGAVSASTTGTTSSTGTTTTSGTVVSPEVSGINVNPPSKEEVKKQGGGPSRGTATIETL